jgi:hypothetical protein
MLPRGGTDRRPLPRRKSDRSDAGQPIQLT